MGNKKSSSKKRQASETVSESFQFFFGWVVKALVSLYTFLILGVLPFYFEDGYTHIGTDKSTFFRSSAVHMLRFIGVAMALWLAFGLINMLQNKKNGKQWKPKVQWSLPDSFALAYGAVVVLSYFCSPYKDTALWGTKGWYMGLIPQLTLVAIYFLVSRFQMGAKWMLYLTICVSSVTFVLGYLNRFDIWPLTMENSGLPMYISTIGNINWYCGYIVSVVFIGIGLFWLDDGKNKWCTILLSAYTFIGFAALVTQGSDSGLFALAFAWMAMFVLSVKSDNPERMKRFWLMVGLFAAACLFTLCIRLLFPERMNFSSGLGDLLTHTICPIFIAVVAVAGWWYTGHKTAFGVWRIASKMLYILIPTVIVIFGLMVAVNTANPGSLGPLSEKSVFTFNNKWGSARGATWKLGAMCFVEQDPVHMLVGVGPDCMVDYLYKGRSDALAQALKEAFPKNRLTNAHNELLTILVNEGILGLVAFAGLLFALVKKLLQHCEHNKYAAVCGLCLVAYIANNIWSFQQSMSVSTIFAVMGLGMYFLREKSK